MWQSEIGHLQFTIAAAPLAQLAEQLTLNQRVIGSSPIRCNFSSTDFQSPNALADFWTELTEFGGMNARRKLPLLEMIFSSGFAKIGLILSSRFSDNLRKSAETTVLKFGCSHPQIFGSLIDSLAPALSASRPARLCRSRPCGSIPSQIFSGQADRIP